MRSLRIAWVFQYSGNTSRANTCRVLPTPFHLVSAQEKVGGPVCTPLDSLCWGQLCTPLGLFCWEMSFSRAFLPTAILLGKHSVPSSHALQLNLMQGLMRGIGQSCLLTMLASQGVAAPIQRWKVFWKTSEGGTGGPLGQLGTEVRDGWRLVMPYHRQLYPDVALPVPLPCTPSTSPHGQHEATSAPASLSTRNKRTAGH